MSSLAPCLDHTFECCDLCCLEELPVHLRVETSLCSAVFAVLVVAVAGITHFNITVIHSSEAVFWA